jgi:hypothetical protein
MFRSVIALLAGFAIMTFTIVIVTIVAVAATGASAGAPTREYLIAFVAYSAAASAFGGFSTAALAPSRPGVHAMGLAAMIFVMHAYTLVFPQPNFPRTVYAFLVVLAPIAAIVGGKSREAQVRGKARTA